MIKNFLNVLCIMIPIMYVIFYLMRVNLKTNKKKKIVKLFVNTFVILFVLIVINLGTTKIFDLSSNDEKTTNNVFTTTTAKELIQDTTEKIAEETTTETTTSTTTMKTHTVASSSSKYKKLAMLDGTVENVGTTSKGYKIQKVNGIYYIDGYMVANKSYGLPQDYAPANTEKYKLTPEVTTYFNDLISAASSAGYSLRGQSGYRSYSIQSSLYNNSVNNNGKEYADKYSARPGYSEHQTGYAMDICDNNLDSSYCISSKYAGTASANWLAENCWKYGFILRYVKNKTDETGYNYESWHFRYVGYDLAKELYNNGDWITLEDYFGIDSKYAE